MQIAGTNDGPVISLVTTDSDATGLTETNDPLTASGTLTVTDVDTTDLVAMSVTNVATFGPTNGLLTADLLSFFSVNPASPSTLTADTGETHNLAWYFNSAPQAFDFLAEGETLTLTYTVQAKDDSGALNDNTTHTVTITIHGANDAPVISVGAGDSDAETLAETDAALAVSGTLTVNDVDRKSVV